MNVPQIVNSFYFDNKFIFDKYINPVPQIQFYFL
jgi:hypothetical protein